MGYPTAFPFLLRFPRFSPDGNGTAAGAARSGRPMAALSVYPKTDWLFREKLGSKAETWEKMG